MPELFSALCLQLQPYRPVKLPEMIHRPTPDPGLQTSQRRDNIIFSPTDQIVTVNFANVSGPGPRGPYGRVSGPTGPGHGNTPY
jgi:hypothetical protein